MKERTKASSTRPAPARRHSFFSRGDGGSFFAGTTVQAKLEVGPVDDPLERQADRIADRIVGGGSAESGEIQRQPMEKEEELLQPKREIQRQPLEEEEEQLQA